MATDSAANLHVVALNAVRNLQPAGISLRQILCKSRYLTTKLIQKPQV